MAESDVAAGELRTCSECGTQFERDTETCPVCGSEHPTGADPAVEARTWLIAGAIPAVAALLVSPWGLILGPIAFFGGYQAFSLGARKWGALVMAVGFIGMNISVFLLFIG
ncbi:MAG: hypothetical protein ABEH64_08695 [Salinirussus sp.]